MVTALAFLLVALQHVGVALNIDVNRHGASLLQRVRIDTDHHNHKQHRHPNEIDHREGKDDREGNRVHDAEEHGGKHVEREEELKRVKREDDEEEGTEEERTHDKSEGDEDKRTHVKSGSRKAAARSEEDDEGGSSSEAGETSSEMEKEEEGFPTEKGREKDAEKREHTPHTGKHAHPTISGDHKEESSHVLGAATGKNTDTPTKGHSSLSIIYLGQPEKPLYRFPFRSEMYQFFTAVICTVLLWYFYDQNVYKKKKTLDEKEKASASETQPSVLQNGDFPDTLWSFYSDGDTCCLSSMFMACRVVDTHVTAGLLEREHAAPASLVFFWWLWPLITCCYLPCKRGELRERLGGKHDGKCRGITGRARKMDVLLYMFCTLCAVVQEARAVDKAVGMKTTLVCGLKDIAEEPVAAPIQVKQGLSSASSIGTKDAVSEKNNQDNVSQKTKKSG